MGISNLLHLLLITTGFFWITSAQDDVPPVWDVSSVQILARGISEATKVGTSLTRLVCTDADGDDIRYKLWSGQAVSVLSNGDVLLAQELDFEKKDDVGYDIAFACFGNLFGFDTSQEVVLRTKISVDDANDNAPVFNTNAQNGYSYQISEAAVEGTALVPDIFITDADRTINALITQIYLICNSPNATELAGIPETSKATCEKFELSSKSLAEGSYSATLSLKSKVDFETRPVYSTKMVAIDTGDGTNSLSTTINIQINIDDAQDLNPIFTNVGSTTTVSEGAKPDTVLNFAISARDGDVGAHRPVKLTIIEDDKDAFTLSDTTDVSGTGIYAANLIVKNALDREAISGAYHFTVKVTELDRITNELTDATATATYSVSVGDINDQTPEFEQSSYEINVTEMATTTEKVQITGLRIVCEDKDEPSNARYRVRIVQQTYPDVFSISPDTEFVGAASMFFSVDNSAYMDYDIPQYRRQVVLLEAKEIGNSNPKSSSTTVTILLTDVNDNNPIFSSSSYSAEISENQPIIPSLILTIMATDIDSGPNGDIEYVLEQGSSSEFSVNSETGALMLQNNVDFENTNQYVFLVNARDKGQNHRSSQVQVTITIVNYNDEYPKFQQTSYQTSVIEGSIDFLTPIVVQATDTEEGTMPITYRILSGQTQNNNFNLNPTTGMLSLNDPLKYEETPLDVNNQRSGKYELVIEASDNTFPDPPLTSEVPVTVYLIDQNNYGPVLNPDTYTKTLKESADPGTVVAEIIGTDDDEGNFGTITYRLSSGGYDNFVVDPVSGVVRVNDPQNFDFNQKNFYTVMIKATDGGSPQKSAFAKIQVTITDVNNKSPKFDKSIYTKTVNEDTAMNVTILTVFATDSDLSQSLRYTILKSTIKARDGDGNELTRDDDYDYVNAIAINSITGGVYVNSKLDKETALEINFQVQVQDINAEKNQPQVDTTQVSLTVTGQVNDDIIFDTVTQNFVNEMSPTNFDVVTLIATDPLHPQDILRFSDVSESDYFDVLPTGVVRPSRLIDYETNPTIHRLIVKAVAADQIRSATATVTINILDINDNDPVFDGGNQHYADVDEDALYPTLVATLHATDRDSSSYGPIVYRMGGGVSSSDFELFDSANGVLVLVGKGRTLNYNIQSVYELVIIASDNPNRDIAGFQNFQSATLTIQVNDKNNNYPKFKFQEKLRKMAVAETAPMQRRIATIIATDDDFGNNGIISYFLESIPGDLDSVKGTQIFRILKDIGTIIVAKPLFGLGGKVYPMRVRATDHGQPSNSEVMDIEITVLSTEIDDGSPQWIKPSEDMSVFVDEEKAIIDVIAPNFFDVIARTGDTISFTLSPLTTYNNSFDINSTTGQIRIVKPLDRELKKSYILSVYAEDTSNPLKYRSSRQIIVNLVDKEDNVPTFTNPKGYSQCGDPINTVVTFNVDENTPANQTVYQLRACDPDGPGHNAIIYQPYNDDPYCRARNAESQIEIQEDGRLTTKVMIDYEQHQEFVLCAIALPSPDNIVRRKRAIDENSIDQTKHNVIYLNIFVTDKNDNGPEFPQDSITAVLNSRPSILDTVVWLNAVDDDGENFDLIEYTIAHVTYHEGGQSRRVDDLFVVKSRSAISPSRTDYERYLNGFFVMGVVATDRLNSSLQDTLTIKIYVYKPGHAIKVTLDYPPSEGYSKEASLTKALNAGAGDYSFVFLQASEHSSGDSVDITKTDICYLGIDTSTNRLMDKPDVIGVLANKNYGDILRSADYNVDNRGPCFPSKSSEESVKWRHLWWVLVVVAIFIFVCCLIFIVLVSVLYRRYKRYLKSKQMYLVPQ